ncbi:MAG TPA: hypothetical protein VGF61_23115 [Candidatus Acidoferrum sp.]|jgi:hypothetical protein
MSSKNVGAPTIPKWNANSTLDIGVCRDRLLRRSAPAASLQPNHPSPNETSLKVDICNRGEIVGAPTFCDLRCDESSDALWRAKACSRFYGLNRESRIFVIKKVARLPKRRRAAALQNVGAPTFPKWTATAIRDFGFCRGRLLRRASLGFAMERPQAGHPSANETDVKAGARIVGAPTFLESPRAVRP